MFTFSQSDRVVNTGHPSDYITLLQNNEDLIVRIFTEERNRLGNIKVRMGIKCTMKHITNFMSGLFDDTIPDEEDEDMELSENHAICLY